MRDNLMKSSKWLDWMYKIASPRHMEYRKIKIGSGSIGVKYQKYPNFSPYIELWPTAGEYPIYDSGLYYDMSNDIHRSKRYLKAIKDIAKDKVVVDIGTGSDLNWAKASIEAGAKKVYAIEVMKDSYIKAKNLITKLNLEKKIKLINGSSMNVELPEKVDLCVSEIIGCIGNSEGACAILQDARNRFLKPDGIMVPDKCITKIAAVSLPDDFYSSPCFTEESAYYVEQTFKHVGHPFDLLLCIAYFPKNHLLSNANIFSSL